MKLNVNESEKDRIRKLHKKYTIIKEQDIDVEIEPVVVDPIGPPIDDDKPILRAPDEKMAAKPATPPIAGIPCATIYNQMQSGIGPAYWANAVATNMVGPACHKCQNHYNHWVSAGQPSSGTDWSLYGPAAQQVCLMLIGNPQCCNPQTQQNYECVNGQCVQDPNGQFTGPTAQQDCQNSGCGDVYCTDCVNGQMTMGTGGVCPGGYVITQGTPGLTPPVAPCYECDGQGNCIGPSWASGPNVSNTQADCQNNCQPPLADYDCINNQCTAVSGGQFTGPTALADCQANCPPQSNLWECNTNNGCSQTPNGTYASQSQCETACCQDVINNWNWAQGSQSNPCQKFYNMFGPMGTTNPNTLPFNQECIYNYLLNLILNLGGPCVSGNFINLLNNFASGNNGCYGNPASGCVNATDPGCPAGNSICGKMDQFCSANPMTPSKFFKCQYAISFANTTGCTC